VVHAFKDGYTQGITPNPCLACNRSIRWDFLLRRALALGANYMATATMPDCVGPTAVGPATSGSDQQDGEATQILRAGRRERPVYVLHVLVRAAAHALFPLASTPSRSA